MGKHETEERYEVQQEERQLQSTPAAVLQAGAALLAAFSAAFHNEQRIITASLLRTIGNSYASMCFAYGPAAHPRSIEELREAMEQYAAVNPAAEPLLFPDVDELLGVPSPSRPAPGPFAVLMQNIRAAYWKKRQTLHDRAALDEIADDGRGYDPKRWPLKHVVNALVRVSPHAQELNQRYYRGSFK